MNENKKTPQDVRDQEELYLKEILKRTKHANDRLDFFFWILVLRTLSEIVAAIRVFIH